MYQNVGSLTVYTISSKWISLSTKWIIGLTSWINSHQANILGLFSNLAWSEFPYICEDPVYIDIELKEYPQQKAVM